MAQGVAKSAYFIRFAHHFLCGMEALHYEIRRHSETAVLAYYKVIEVREDLTTNFSLYRIDYCLEWFRR